MNRAKRETIKRYNEIAEEYSKDWRGEHDELQLKHLRRFEEMIGSPAKRILDAGCGTGKDSIYFASHDYDVYGVDLSPGMIEKATEGSNNRDLNINFLIGDMKFLNFPNNCFDGVWTAAALVHLSPEDKRKAIQEFYRVLKPEGVLHIWVQNLLAPKHLMRLMQSHLFYLELESGKVLTRRKSIKEITEGKSMRERIRLGYTYLDNRHWFYPTKFSLLKMLEDEGFSILESNHVFSRRLSVYARK